MKARWQAGIGVQRAYTRLERFVSEAIAEAAPDSVVGGGVQTDAVALLVEDPLVAVDLGRALFQAAFEYSNDQNRMWLRGVIVAGGHPRSRLLIEHPMTDAPDGVRVRRLSRRLLTAINVEASGFKGQRLLIAPDIDIAARHATTPGGHQLELIRRLRNSGYPSPACDGYRDVLWMAPEDLSSWEE